MALQYAGYWADHLHFLSGLADQGEAIVVYLTGTTTAAVLYSNHLKSGTVANPIVSHPTSSTDTEPGGNYEFYAVPGYYDLYRFNTGQFLQTVLVPMDPADPGAGGGGPGLSGSNPQSVAIAAAPGSTGQASDAGHIHLANVNDAAHSRTQVVYTGGASSTTALTEISSQLQIDGGVGFYGTTPVAKPTVTGDTAGNAGLASLLTALAGQGLIVNNTVSTSNTPTAVDAGTQRIIGR